MDKEARLPAVSSSSRRTQISKRSLKSDRAPSSLKKPTHSSKKSGRGTNKSICSSATRGSPPGKKQRSKSYKLSRIYIGNDAMSKQRNEEGCSGYFMIVFQGFIFGVVFLFYVYTIYATGHFFSRNGFYLKQLFANFILSVAVLSSLLSREFSARLLIVLLYFFFIFINMSVLVDGIDEAYRIIEASNELKIEGTVGQMLITFFVLTSYAFLIFAAIDHAGNSDADEDKVEKMIFETTSHRKKKVLGMVANLTRAASNEINKARVGVSVVDEAGKPLKFAEGSKIRTDVKESRGMGATMGRGWREVVFNSDVECSTVVSTPGTEERVAALPSVPPKDSSTKRSLDEELSFNGFCYNSCDKAYQLSPRVAL